MDSTIALHCKDTKDDTQVWNSESSKLNDLTYNAIEAGTYNVFNCQHKENFYMFWKKVPNQIQLCKKVQWVDEKSFSCAKARIS